VSNRSSREWFSSLSLLAFDLLGLPASALRLDRGVGGDLCVSEEARGVGMYIGMSDGAFLETGLPATLSPGLAMWNVVP